MKRVFVAKAGSSHSGGLLGVEPQSFTLRQRGCFGAPNPMMCHLA